MGSLRAVVAPVSVVVLRLRILLRLLCNLFLTSGLTNVPRHLGFDRGAHFPFLPTCLFCRCPLGPRPFGAQFGGDVHKLCLSPPFSKHLREMGCSFLFWCAFGAKDVALELGVGSGGVHVRLGAYLFSPGRLSVSPTPDFLMVWSWLLTSQHVKQSWPWLAVTVITSYYCWCCHTHPLTYTPAKNLEAVRQYRLFCLNIDRTALCPEFTPALSNERIEVPTFTRNEQIVY